MLCGNAPLCESKYKSEGGYYGHLQIKHRIGRNGKKLSTALIEQLSKEKDKNIEKQKEKEDISVNSNENENRKKNPDTLIHPPNNAENKEDNSGRKEEHATSSSASSKEMTHTCPFPSCNNIVLKNDDMYYQHLWEQHKLGRNK